MQPLQLMEENARLYRLLDKEFIFLQICFKVLPKGRLGAEGFTSSFVFQWSSEAFVTFFLHNNCFIYTYLFLPNLQAATCKCLVWFTLYNLSVYFLYLQVSVIVRWSKLFWVRLMVVQAPRNKNTQWYNMLTNILLFFDTYTLCWMRFWKLLHTAQCQLNYDPAFGATLTKSWSCCVDAIWSAFL